MTTNDPLFNRHHRYRGTTTDHPVVDRTADFSMLQEKGVLMSDYLWVKETHSNETEDYILGEDVEYETGCTEKGDLFREYLQDGWRCSSKIYIDDEPIGWHFEKINHYEDTGGPFLHGMWVEVLVCKPIRTVSYNYA